MPSAGTTILNLKVEVFFAGAISTRILHVPPLLAADVIKHT
jgi:hypothetical protein